MDDEDCREQRRNLALMAAGCAVAGFALRLCDVFWRLPGAGEAATQAWCGVAFLTAIAVGLGAVRAPNPVAVYAISQAASVVALWMFGVAAARLAQPYVGGLDALYAFYNGITAVVGLAVALAWLVLVKVTPIEHAKGA